MQSQSAAPIHKLVIIGDSHAGKTNIITRYVRDAFDEVSRPTIGVEFFQKELALPAETVVLQLWDTAGQERFRGMASAYYRKAVGVVLVYDITSKASFANLDKWLDEILAFAEPDAQTVLMGNKKDLVELRQVSVEEGLEFARKHEMLFFETSALVNDDHAIELAFLRLTEKVLARRALSRGSDEARQERKDISQLDRASKRKRCC